MKHLFLKDDELTFMVYYQPKKKAQMLDFIYKKQQYFNRFEIEKTHLLKWLIKELQTNGFKCVEITDEFKNAININYDLDEESFVYRTITITQSRQYSCFHFRIGKAFYTLATLEEAIETIDKELR